MQFLLFGIAREFQDLHTVAQGRRNCLQGIGCGDKHHPGQVKSEIQVVITEVIVLLRVKHFQQGRGGIAAPVCADLINLVQHDHRVIGLHAAQRLYDASRHGADIGAAVTANLGLIANAAKRHAGEPSSERSGD